MAYAEKVPSPSGDYWRGRFKDPGGSYATVRDEGNRVVRFAKKNDAKKAADAAEVAVQKGTWRDPATGRILFRDWAGEWYAELDLSRSTMVNYKSHLENHLLPFFGDTALADIDQALITRWRRSENAAGYAADSVRTWAGTLHNVLGDAVGKHIGANPATGKRGKGKRSGAGRRSSSMASREVPVVSPLGVLLIAERMSILTGRDDEFVMVQTGYWAALRLGETVGLERKYVRDSRLKVQWQLYEIAAGDNEELRAEAPGGFLRCPPKDDSYRDVRLPPFMAELLGRHIARARPAPCECHGRAYVFRGWGASPRRRGTLPMRDLAQIAGVSEGAVRKVLGAANGTGVGDETRAKVMGAVRATGWRPLPGDAGPAWHWRRSGYEELFGAASSARFPARSGRPERAVPLEGDWPGRRVAGRNCEGRAEWCWLPVAEGAHPHLGRHWQKTWMEAARTPEVLSEEVLGHKIPGISGTYRHVSPEMRAELAAAQTAAWEAALDARLAMSPWSPVGVLQDLLSARAEARKPRLLSRDSPGTPEGVYSLSEQTPSELGGRYWDRTSDLFGVNEV